MKKKLALSFLFMFLLSFSFIISYAEDGLKVSLFDGDIFLNGNKLKSDSEYNTLLYNGHIYVPLRNLSEILQGTVSYYEKDNVADINIRGGKNSYKSEISSAKSDDFFKLSIHSEKEVYGYGQDINIWGILAYTGKEEKTIAHSGSDPLIIYSLTDELGYTYDPGRNLSLAKTNYKENDVYYCELPWINIFGYNYFEPNSNKNSVLSSESKALLKRGTYTVTAQIKYSDPKGLKTEYNLKTSIKIKIE
ncbi:copper amine oxidase N-terminal domain-containing protein [Paenibacillus allorhizosphaerae]|uniref:Copper amine oxidase-like N-terminal domain-containing protein n=1 Tax=Paenibacillus allorhizosphaerae TaxID=2849866 RepID=A0ABM8VNW9_9BACL|nr:copper amine oxidase N-terminal domain-containing protein [Paenibacillus allorhizosphaerae]CAG7652119.1 hypothetical protein PAECIP111802_05142 [Paenibacillus allorhizosphaerae]